MNEAAKRAAKRIADMQTDDVRKKVETGDQYGSFVTECPYVEDHIARMSSIDAIAAIIDEELAMFTAENVKQLEILELDKRTFTQPDSTLTDIIECEKARLKDAAQMLGREWVGMFTEAHVWLIAKAYYFAKNGERHFNPCVR